MSFGIGRIYGCIEKEGLHFDEVIARVLEDAAR